MNPKRPNGLARKPQSSLQPETHRFMVCVVVERKNGDYANCAGLEWEFHTFAEAKGQVDKLVAMFRNGRIGKPSRTFPFVVLWDRKTERNYDYQV